MEIVLVSPTGLLADALACWLRALASQVKVLQFTLSEIQSLPLEVKPRLAVIDIDVIPSRSLRDAIGWFRLEWPRAVLVAMGTQGGRRFAERTLKAGANAYLQKRLREADARMVFETVLKMHPASHCDARPGSNNGSTVASPTEARAPSRPRRRGNGPYGLTGRELDVLELACYGFSNLQIAKRHGISVGVVKLHLHHAYNKLGVEGRIQAIRVVQNLDAIHALHLQRVESAPPVLDYLLPHMSHERYRKGHVLFRKGEPGNEMFYVQRGRVRLPELGVHMAQGDMFGELGVFAPARARTSSAQCEVDTDLFKLTADQTKRLCLENPQFAYYVIRLIADRLVSERETWGIRGGRVGVTA